MHCGVPVKVRKPVESGCEYDPANNLIPADGAQLFSANNYLEDLSIITPFRFHAALAPDHAARLENKTITLAQLKAAVEYNVEKQDRLIVEGAGGFLSPLASDAVNADLARALGLEVIVVIENRLGAINQALLTIKAVEDAGLSIHAIILNQIQAEIDPRLDNMSELKERIAYPLFNCDFNGQLQPGVFC